MFNVTERASMDEADHTELTLGPRMLYPAKAAVTRARSLLWHARTRGRPVGIGLRILFYHRVSDDRDELAVTPAAFTAQMEWLAKAGYRALHVAEAVSQLRAGNAEGVVGLSFDDGYLDVAEHAGPVLERLGFSATVFVATGVTDGRESFSWYARQPPLIGWEQMRELDERGTLRFEGHTVSHPNLLALGDDGAAAEIGDGKRELEERLGRPVSVFCYPAGLFGERERRLVAGAGFELATSCEPGLNTTETDPYALRRVQVDARDALVDVRAKVLGGHDSPLPLRAVYRRLRFGASTRS
jgi:peptidoglycan/xylan/chitin deacetylase (PgdA/CDA1 family)